MFMHETDILTLATKACHCIWIDRDIFKFKLLCSKDVDITGFTHTDNIHDGNFNGVNAFPFLQNTSMDFVIDDENYSISYNNGDICIVMCEINLSVIKNDESTPVKTATTLTFHDTGSDTNPEIVNAHFSLAQLPEDKYNALISQPDITPDTQAYSGPSDYYRELIINNCDLFIECDTDEYILKYDKDRYQTLFDDDTYHTNPDRWFWHMCDNCVHPEDYEQLDIFRRADIAKRIKNNITKVETTFRVKNKDQGYIWILLQIITKIENDKLEKTAMIFTKLDKSQFNELDFLEKNRRDKLTSLYNKTYFDYLFGLFLKDVTPSSLSTLLLIDIDDFHLVNDTFGHLTGDVILTQFSRSLNTFFGSNSVIGRVGGDKFAVLIKAMPSKYEITKLIDNFIKNIRHTHSEMGNSIDIHCSAGIVIIDSPPYNASRIQEAGRLSLAVAKNKGKNCYVIYNTEVAGQL